MIRIKQQMSSPDVDGARSRLDDVLQTLVDQADRTEEGNFENGSPDSPDEDSKLDLKREISKGKKSKRSGKRRHKDYLGSIMDTSFEKGKHQHSHVMTFFDRKVDLAQFKPNTSLYPVCREWMMNRPGTRRIPPIRVSTPEPLSDPEDEGDNPELKDIFSLPPPSIPSDVIREKHGRNPRIPSPVPQPEEKLDIHRDPSQAPSRETLLQDHLVRWRTIRQKWKNSSEDYLARHNESYLILKAMFDR